MLSVDKAILKSILGALSQEDMAEVEVSLRQALDLP
jgi:hypothetical protein